MKKVHVSLAQKIQAFSIFFLGIFVVSMIGDMVWTAYREGNILGFLYSIIVIPLVITVYWNEIKKEELEKRERMHHRREERLRWKDDETE